MQYQAILYHVFEKCNKDRFFLSPQVQQILHFFEGFPYKQR